MEITHLNQCRSSQSGPATSMGITNPNVHSMARFLRVCGNIPVSFGKDGQIICLNRTTALLGSFTDCRLVIKYSRRVMINVAMGFTTYVIICRCETFASDVSVSTTDSRKGGVRTDITVHI